jgi:hypothetical protein
MIKVVLRSMDIINFESLAKSSVSTAIGNGKSLIIGKGWGDLSIVSNKYHVGKKGCVISFIADGNYCSLDNKKNLYVAPRDIGVDVSDLQSFLIGLNSFVCFNRLGIAQSCDWEKLGVKVWNWIVEMNY